MDKTEIFAMVRLIKAIDELGDAAIQLKALHFHRLNTDQRERVMACVDFRFADERPPDVKNGDGTYWHVKHLFPVPVDKPGDGK